MLKKRVVAEPFQEGWPPGCNAARPLTLGRQGGSVSVMEQNPQVYLGYHPVGGYRWVVRLGGVGGSQYHFSSWELAIRAALDRQLPSYHWLRAVWPVWRVNVPN